MKIEATEIGKTMGISVSPAKSTLSFYNFHNQTSSPTDAACSGACHVDSWVDSVAHHAGTGISSVDEIHHLGFFPWLTFPAIAEETPQQVVRFSEKNKKMRNG